MSTSTSTRTGIALAAVTALVSGVAVYLNGMGVRAVGDATTYTMAKNLVAALVLLAVATGVAAARGSGSMGAGMGARGRGGGNVDEGSAPAGSEVADQSTRARVACYVGVEAHDDWSAELGCRTGNELGRSPVEGGGPEYTDGVVAEARRCECVGESLGHDEASPGTSSTCSWSNPPEARVGCPAAARVVVFASPLGWLKVAGLEVGDRTALVECGVDGGGPTSREALRPRKVATSGIGADLVERQDVVGVAARVQPLAHWAAGGRPEQLGAALDVLDDLWCRVANGTSGRWWVTVDGAEVCVVVVEPANRVTDWHPAGRHDDVDRRPPVAA